MTRPALFSTLEAALLVDLSRYCSSQCIKERSGRTGGGQMEGGIGVRLHNKGRGGFQDRQC